VAALGRHFYGAAQSPGFLPPNKFFITLSDAGWALEAILHTDAPCSIAMLPAALGDSDTDS